MYDDIVEKYYDDILRYCQRKLNGSKTAAEDVTQEVFFALYKKLNRLKLGDNIKLWLFRAADREIKAYIRKNPSFIPIESIEDTMADNADFYYECDDLECLNSEEKALLKEYYGSDNRESVAKSHKLNMNTLYIRIHKIKKKLRNSLGEKHKIT